MRISTAGLTSDLPTTRFAAQSSNRREARLGLRRRLAPQITSHPAAHARVPLLSALRSAARGQTRTATGVSAETTARSHRSAILRRSDSMTWSQPTNAPVRSPRPRSAAPWRG